MYWRLRYGIYKHQCQVCSLVGTAYYQVSDCVKANTCIACFHLHAHPVDKPSRVESVHWPSERSALQGAWAQARRE